MSNIRYYTDENVPRAIINGLRQRGVNVLSVPEADMSGESDDVQLAYAFEQKRVIFTQDTDFLRLATEMKHAGIVYDSQKLSIGDVIRGLMLIHSILESEDMLDTLEFL